MILPILLKVRTSLLVNFLFYVEITFIQNSYVVCKYCYFNIRPNSTNERWTPSLNKHTWNHDIVSWLYNIDEIILKYNNNWSRDHTWLQSFINFLNFYLLVVLILCCSVYRDKESIIAITNHHSIGSLLLSIVSLTLSSSLSHILNITLLIIIIINLIKHLIFFN